LRTPRSPLGSTSGRPSWNISSISTVQRPTQRAPVGHRAVEGARGEVAQRGDLAAAQARGAQRFVRRVEQLPGLREPRVERDEPALDRARRRTAELLVNDRAGEVLEGRRTAVVRAQPIGSRGFDHRGQHRVGVAEVRQQPAARQCWHAAHQ
jgi:hypothetical protein